MSSLRDPIVTTSLIPSVEKATSPIPHVRRSLKIEPNNVTKESKDINIDPGSPNESSILASRGSSPAQQNYRSFRPPVNDSKGYYANARRQVYGSSSPTQASQGRPAYGPPSPSYVPRSFPDIRRAATGGYTGLEDDDDDIDIDDDLPPQSRKLPVSRVPACDSNADSGADTLPSAASRGHTFQRKNRGDRSKFPSSKPYVGVDHEMNSYDDEDTDSEWGAREESHYGHNSTTLRKRKLREFDNQQDAIDYPRHLNRAVEERSGPRPQIDARLGRPRSSGKDREVSEEYRHNQILPSRDDESFETDNESSLFIKPRTRLPSSPPCATTATSSDYGTPRPLFSHDTLVSAPSIHSVTSSNNKRRKVTHTSPQPRFNNPGLSLDSSRYSGDPDINWGLNQDPPSVPQNSVSDAALLKRGLTRGAKEKVCKRGYGANDPENVNIVNMKEEGQSFGEIVEILNAQRVATGRDPSLSICGVTSRYNRTAPLLFAAEGRQFIPLSKRGKGNEAMGDGPVVEKAAWDDDLDLILAQVAKDVDKEKWGRVAKEYNRRTGKNISAAAAALRHTIL